MAEQTRKIVRIVSTDLPGELETWRALMRIKGIGPFISRAVCFRVGIEPRTIIGNLPQDAVEKIENEIKTPNMPGHVLNFRKNEKTGQNEHIITSKLDFMTRDRINAMRSMRAYKGIRHELGQPVRGQSTRSTFRHNKSVGVQKKKALAARSGKKEPKSEK